MPPVFLLVLMTIAVAHHSTHLDTTTVIDCDALNTTLCLDQEVLLYCDTAHRYLQWEVPDIANCIDSHELDFTYKAKIGDNKTCTIFKATLVNISGQSMFSSKLTFKMQPEYNNSNITCFDGLSGHAQTCYITMAGKANRPFNVSAHKQNKESMEVKWKPPFFSGGVPIDYYDATVSPPPHDGTCSSGNCSVPGTSITINGLECSSYNITIQARNCVGQGSLFNLSTTSELPGKVINLSMTANGSIHWNPPLQNDNGEEKIINYKVSVAALGGKSWNRTQTSFSYTRFLNLSNGEYNMIISVQAVNCHGEGDPVFIPVNSPYSSIYEIFVIILLSCAAVLIFILFCTCIFLWLNIRRRREKNPDQQ